MEGSSRRILLLSGILGWKCRKNEEWRVEEAGLLAGRGVMKV
jgi:hypothetical protein